MAYVFAHGGPAVTLVRAQKFCQALENSSYADRVLVNRFCQKHIRRILVHMFELSCDRINELLEPYETIQKVLAEKGV